MPPATDADGSAVAALSGYRIYYGTSSGSYSGSVFVSGASASSGSVTGLSTGRWYFIVTAVSSSGAESSVGYEVSKAM